MVMEWVILIYLVGPMAPIPVYVSSERFPVQNESGCKARAAQIHEKMAAYKVECVPVHSSG
jgi:hypothetical protein